MRQDGHKPVHALGDYDNMTCKLCYGRCAFLGALGNLRWFRCIQCGMEWSRRSRKCRDY